MTNALITFLMSLAYNNVLSVIMIFLNSMNFFAFLKSRVRFAGQFLNVSFTIQSKLFILWYFIYWGKTVMLIWFPRNIQWLKKQQQQMKITIGHISNSIINYSRLKVITGTQTFSRSISSVQLVLDHFFLARLNLFPIIHVIDHLKYI